MPRDKRSPGGNRGSVASAEGTELAGPSVAVSAVATQAGASPSVLDIGLSSHPSLNLSDMFGVDGLAPADLGLWVPSLTVRTDDIGRIRIAAFADRTGGEGSESGRASAARARAGRLPYTTGLTPLARRTLEGAGLKAVANGRPLVSMMTLTVDDEHLPALSPNGDEPPAELLGTHLNQLLNLLRHRARRKGLPSPQYLWVAESSSRGVRSYNPHIHLLFDFTVPRAEWDDFIAAVTASWGLGHVKFERLRNPSAAGFYCTKNYLTKDGKRGGSGGKVYGRRWGVSRGIRPIESREVVPASDNDAMLLREVTHSLGSTGRRAEFLGARVHGGGLFPPVGSDVSDWVALIPALHDEFCST